eukprot:m.155530 g.155530  ORF g.155530 m.155530 type:complete len:326 (+) comp52912_c0_seq1:45-1022(+)
MSSVAGLVEMGFSETRARRALDRSNHDMQGALEYLIAHADDPTLDEPLPEAKGHSLTEESAPDASGSDAQALSLRCDDCGKRLRSTQDCEAHAARTNHSNFSESTEEIKPLTEAEKAEKLAALQKRIAEKRAVAAEAEKQHVLENEIKRRATGKELADAKRLREEMEIRKLAEEKRREKEETDKAKAKVRQQIAQDQAAREAQRLKASGAPVPAVPAAAPADATPAAAPAPAAAAPVAAPAPAAVRTETKIQVRMLSGSPIVQVFSSSAPLQEVFNFVVFKGGYSEKFSLLSTRPSRNFTLADANLTLQQAGLVPSAVLVVTRNS